MFKVYNQHDKPLKESDMGDKKHQVRETYPFSDFYNQVVASKFQFPNARMTLEWRDSPCVFSDRHRVAFADSDFVCRVTNTFPGDISDNGVVVWIKDHQWLSSISGEHEAILTNNNGKITFTGVEDNKVNGPRRRVFAFRLRYQYTINDTRGD